MTTITKNPYAKFIKTFYADQQAIHAQGVLQEMTLRRPFESLLASAGKLHGWTLLTEQTLNLNGKNIRPDGVFRDEFQLRRGCWESKDTQDNLEKEIEAKRAKGYPLTNIIFEDSQRAILFQDNKRALEVSLADERQVHDLLKTYFEYREPAYGSFEEAVTEFKDRVRELGLGLAAKIAEAHIGNRAFQTAYKGFETLCRESLNPTITRQQVDEMLIQHLLTDRLMRKVIDNVDFLQKNIIAREIEKVIAALTSHSFSREEYLQRLDGFYNAIESTARTLADFTEKQTFLNEVYERFFQGYSVKTADTHGIVYTPQPIVNFMCQSVEEVLQKEFNLRLGDPGVVILDPCTGTGNFIVNLINRVPLSRLQGFYRDSLFANEVMLLPYYVAALNIEYAYYQRAEQYLPFEGLCFVDTLDIVAERQGSLFTQANTERVAKQKAAPITVIIGNPPYNAGQQNENDNNKNRRYLGDNGADTRIQETYVRDSKATNKNSVYDPYVKFFRWASDRLEKRDGIVCYVSNNSFVDQLAFDGMRQHLLQDFSHVYHVDLHGNVRQNPKISGTSHNVFGIQVGVGITVAVRRASHTERKIFYFRVPELWRKEQKLNWLDEHKSIEAVKWQPLTPDHRHSWIIPKNADAFDTLIPMGSKDAKAVSVTEPHVIFKQYGGGIKSNRDSVVYDFQRETLQRRMANFVEAYNAEVDRFKRAGGAAKVKDVDSWVQVDKVKWSAGLKTRLKSLTEAVYSPDKIRESLYRPFTKRQFFFDPVVNEALYQMPYFFPTVASESENRAILVKVGSAWEMFPLMVNCIPDLLPQSGSQVFPFYTYHKDGSNRRENITDWALKQFQAHYADPSITKWDIFYYVYAALHDPAYREKYAEALNRDLPKLPYHSQFHERAAVGRRLSELHIGYESVAEYPLKWEESGKGGLRDLYRVKKMTISRDRTAIQVNDHLRLSGIPPEAWAYKLGNKSALEWVIDQYQVKDDSDPNREDDPEYIVRLIGRVVRVSVETVELTR
jgi:predicted helicase